MVSVFPVKKELLRSDSGSSVGSRSNRNVLPWRPHLPPAHPVSWAVLWPWGCWRPSAGTEHWAQESRAPAPPSAAAPEPLSALPLREWHPPALTLSVSWAERDTWPGRGVNSTSMRSPVGSWGWHISWASEGERMRGVMSGTLCTKNAPRTFKTQQVHWNSSPSFLRTCP